MGSYIQIQIRTIQLLICTLKFSPLPGFEQGTSPVPSRYATWAILAWIQSIKWTKLLIHTARAIFYFDLLSFDSHVMLWFSSPKNSSASERKFFKEIFDYLYWILFIIFQLLSYLFNEILKGKNQFCNSRNNFDIDSEVSTQVEVPLMLFKFIKMSFILMFKSIDQK